MAAKKVQKIRPNQSGSEQLDLALGNIRNLTKDGERFQVSVMEALMDLHEHREIWSVRYDEWDTLLKEEGFTTPHTFNFFVKAFKTLGRDDVRRLGVRASVLLIQQPAEIRSKVHKLVDEWFKTHDVPPTYQRVAVYVRKIVGEKKPAKRVPSKDETIVALRKAKRDYATQVAEQEQYISKLLRHIWKLNATLRKNRLPPSPAPERS